MYFFVTNTMSYNKTFYYSQQQLTQGKTIVLHMEFFCKIIK